MELLLTDAFLEEARRSPERLREPLRRLAARPAGEERCGLEPVGDGGLVGWTREDEGRLGLWYLAGSELESRAAETPPLAATSRGELRELGVDDGLIPGVQRAVSLEALRGLRLPARVLAKVEFAFRQQLLGIPATREALRRRATSAAHLDHFLHGDITELLLNLDPEQRRMVELPGSGTVVIRGVAGSGKTAVLLHRIYGLLGQRSLLERPRVLLLTYNRALAHAAQELLLALGIRHGELEVATVHKWCKDFGAERARPLDFRERRALLWEARERVRGREPRSALWRHPFEFWDAELHRIEGRAVGSLGEYAGMRRVGAGRGLDPAQRELVWQVREEYRARLEREGRLDWDGVVAGAAKRLEAMGEARPRYDHVFVDEAQDLTVAALRLVASLPAAAGSLLVAYDAAQSIYERGFRWRDCGIAVSSRRSFELRRNHRNTGPILKAARPLLRAMAAEEQGPESEAMLEPVEAERSGPAPRLLEAPPGTECRVAARDVRRLIEVEAVPPQNIAVLCYPNRVRDQMEQALRAEAVSCQKHGAESAIRLADPSVKVLPVKSAKGLEFPVVYLLASSGSYTSLGAYGDGWGEELRRVLYMAMTRAMSTLVVVHESGALLPMLRHLAPPPP